MLIFAIALSATATADVNPSDYPELAPGVLLPPILNELRQTLTDPYSIRDFTLCPAGNIKLKNGKPTGWHVSIAFNAKNTFGGYAGRKTYSVLFRNGQIRGGISSTQFAKTDGIEGLINSMVVRKMAGCPTVPDDEIQRLLSPGASPLKEVR